MNRKHLLGVAGIISLVVLVLVSWPDVSAQNGSRSDLLTEIDSIVRETMESDHLVGTSIGVKKGGEVIVAKRRWRATILWELRSESRRAERSSLPRANGYGYADLENEVKATEHTVYRIGSITKQFTAASIMKLVEAGKLSLDDDLTKFLPDYPTNGHKVTIDRLLNHTSGIKAFTAMPEYRERIRLDLSQEELTDIFSAVPFEFAPGDEYKYNNSAYFLLGTIIEKVSGESYEDFLAGHIWEPLGMLESHYLDNSPIVPNRAEGYEYRDGRVVNDDPISMRLPFSAGALGSSVTDLFTWQSALLNNRVVGESSYERMITPGSLNDGERLAYGYGLAVGEMGGHRKISHGGGINGFRTHLSYYPDDDLTVVVLTNTGSASPQVLEGRIAQTVLGTVNE